MNGDRGRSPRAAIIVAHGLGIWVVKRSLTLMNGEVNQIEPMGFFFYDVPRVRDPIVSISTRPELNRYLHDFSKIFNMELVQGKLPGLMTGMTTIDEVFHSLMVASYGLCEEIGDRQGGGVSYTARSMCNNIWTSASPILTFEKSRGIQDFARHVQSLLLGCRLNTEEPVRKLEDLGLGKEISETISGRGFHDPSQIPTIVV
ncbi:hypothetical protein F5B19DRAFT_80985 [Rostrohypoxylon terebratum]|nr:hypothetical protein F5B19DRAFT_80985 [Rostrohypoxylon terebratum]